MTEVEELDETDDEVDEEDSTLDVVDIDDVEEIDLDDDDAVNGNPATETWFSKAEPLMEQVKKTTLLLCKRPGTLCSIDEMMKLFKGRSGQTWRMKHKPIKEGYKFFALCDKETGLVFSFFPDGRLQSSTIAGIVGKLVDKLPEPDRYNYILGMDNYFTTDRVLCDVNRKRIGFIGTARGRRGWPPAEYKEIDEERFNCVHLMPSTEGDYLICRWVDNNIVTMVTNIHKGNESILKQRKRPRLTATNKDNFEPVWGEEFVRGIKIPTFIDDYNNTMLGVDKADQMIAYYRPKLRCRRTWMPIMFHCLDVLRINAYVVAKQLGDIRLEHKQFVEELINVLLGRATSEEAAMTRNAVRMAMMTTPTPTKRKRTSATNPRLPEERFSGNRSEHVAIISKKQGACRYCSYLHAVAKGDIALATPPKIRTPARMCVACGVHLCLQHFDIYHTAL